MWWVVLLACVLTGCRVIKHDRQLPTPPSPPVRYGVVADWVRDDMAALWDNRETAVEHGYCITRFHITRVPDEVVGDTNTVFWVDHVVPAQDLMESQGSALFHCAWGQPELHSHPPTTCLTRNPLSCSYGGPEAWSCQPSRQDYRHLVKRGDPFAVVWCDKNAYRFYYPQEYR